MTKRFTYVKNNSITQYQSLPIQEIGKGKAFHCQGIVDKLNKLSDENEQLWNKKERYKKLSEIRQQEINNRILTIKEFINNCSDNKVRSVLKELFYSEVNEYDLSSENRKLLNENEQLKQLTRNLGDFRNFITEKNVSNEKQRKELQLQMLRLYNYFENYFEDAMGHNAFSEMWDNVKEDEKWEKRCDWID